MLGGVLLVALCAILIAAYLVFLKPSYKILFSQLRPADAAAIVGELEKRKIDFRIEDGGSTILVPERDVDSARLDVMSNDLPIKGMIGFEIFNKSDMGLTEFAQKINYQRALQGELARTIMTIDGVDTARVHLSLSEPSIFKADRIPPKASVTIATRPGMVLAQGAVGGIQRLVAASVPELDVANVVVLDAEGQVVSPASSNMAEASSPFLQQKAAIESFAAAGIRERLKPDYPIENVEVAVWADLNVDSAMASTADGPVTSGTARDYRLIVTFTPHVTLSDTARGDIVARTADAIGFNSGLGDVISFGAYIPRPVERAAPATLSPGRMALSPAFERDSSSLESPWGWVAGLILGAIAIVGVFGGISMARSRRRRAFVGRFQAILDEQGEDRLGRA